MAKKIIFNNKAPLIFDFNVELIKKYEILKQNIFINDDLTGIKFKK